MIVVISIERDPSTNDVCDWINHFGYDVFRINHIQDICSFLSKNNIALGSNNILDDIVDSVWYRRRPSTISNKDIFENTLTQTTVNEFYRSEQQAVFQAFCAILSKKRWLNNWNNSSPGKIEQLLIAFSIGLKIPSTTIIGNKTDLYHFLLSNGKIITKPIQDVRSVTVDDIQYSQYTTPIKKKDISAISYTFFPGLFQKNIKKNLEIRSFYLNGRMYSMAICSSFDKQTKTDFRRYNDKHPNRRVPYQLPIAIEEKIHVFMNRMNLNCGSIDLILGSDGEYYFLEVNPVGQFGMVSYPCNYYLEREMANFLTDN